MAGKESESVVEAKKLYSAEFWETCKQLFESHPTITATNAVIQISEQYGIKPPARSTVSRRVSNYNWKKEVKKQVGLDATQLTQSLHDISSELNKIGGNGKTDKRKRKKNNSNNQSDSGKERNATQRNNATTQQRNNATSTAKEASHGDMRSDEDKRMDKVLTGLDAQKDDAINQEVQNEDEEEPEPSLFIAPLEISDALKASFLLDKITSAKIIEANRKLNNKVRVANEISTDLAMQLLTRFALAQSETEIKAISVQQRLFNQIASTLQVVTNNLRNTAQIDTVYHALNFEKLEDKAELRAMQSVDMNESQASLNAKKKAQEQKMGAYKRKLELVRQEQAETDKDIGFKEHNLDDDSLEQEDYEGR